MPTEKLEPTKTVTAFLTLWEQPGGLERSFRDYFTPNTVWENVGLATATGADEAIKLNAQMAQAIGIATIRAENLSVAVTGTRVLTERIDHFFDNEGRLIHSAPCMGIFEVAGGKITAWRDYLDTVEATRLLNH